MWLTEIFANPSPNWYIFQLDLFRVLYSISLLIKYSTETNRGYFEYFKPHTYLYFLNRINKPNFKITEDLYKRVYILKFIAATLLLIGIFPHFSLVIILLGLALELNIYFKYHTNFFFLLGLCLLFYPDLGSCLNLFRYLFSTNSLIDLFRADLYHQGFPFVQPFIISLVSAMYISSAYRKLNQVFLSGRVVYRTLKFVLEEYKSRKHFDFWIPRQCVEFFSQEDEKNLTKLCFPLMSATVLLEFTLPFLLIFQPTWGIAFVMGTLMHLGFTLLFPATLLHFSLISVFSYLVFVDPRTFALYTKLLFNF